MSITSDSDRDASADGTDEPHGAAEETHHVSLGVYLRCRYWGRVLIYAAFHAIGLGLLDAAVPFLNWQLVLLAVCLVLLLAIGTLSQLVMTFLVLLPATGVQVAMFLDRPNDPQRMMIASFSLLLALFAIFTVCWRAPRQHPPRQAMLNLPDGRQIPLLLGSGPCQKDKRTWQAVSASGPIRLADGWAVSHVGRRRVTIEPVIYHDEQGRAYVPDLHGLRDTL